MPNLTVNVNYALREKRPETIRLTTVVSQEQMDCLMPTPPFEADKWAYLDEAIKLIAPLVKQAIFPHEFSRVETVDDFRRLGVWYLEWDLRNGPNDSNFIKLIPYEPEKLPIK